MRVLVESLLRSRSGATMIEYGLIAALVALAAMLGMMMVGTSVNGIFGFVGGTLAAAQ